jgi:ribose-phosphate pyrophosphokinase
MIGEDIKIFAGSSGKPFAEKMCAYAGIELGASEVITFSDGNLFVRIGESVRDKDINLVQPIGVSPNDEFTEILFWMDAFKRASAKSVTAIIPYFGYAKGDKKDEPRVSIRARVCAECIELAGADRVITMDLHSPQIQGFFKKPVDNLFALPILSEYIKRLALEEYVVVSPDTGFAKQARKYASYLSAPVAIADKMRKAHDERAEVLDIIGEVKDKDAVIVDDFTISAGTIVNLAKMLKLKGTKKVYACLSHCLLTKEGLQRIQNSDIDMLITTDTVYNENAIGDKIKIISAAPLFAEAVIRSARKDSLCQLFDSVPEKVLKYSINI